MFKLIIQLLLVGAAFVTGVWYNESAHANRVSRAVHQAADRVETIRQDLVARARHMSCDHEPVTRLTSRPPTQAPEPTPEQLQQLLEQFLRLTEKQVAQQSE